MNEMVFSEGHWIRRTDDQDENHRREPADRLLASVAHVKDVRDDRQVRRPIDAARPPPPAAGASIRNSAHMCYI